MRFHIPSLMLETPGCWAWEEIGALLAGVFCGVLFFQSVFSQAVKEAESYGATGKSAFLFLMGSDMVVGELVQEREEEGGGLKGKSLEFWGRKMVWKMVGSLAPVAGGAWRDATCG